MLFGYANGAIWSTFTVTGPVEAFRGVPTLNGTFNGTFPTDWNDPYIWSDDLVDEANKEVQNQFMSMFVSSTVIAIGTFIGIIIIAKDAPEVIPSKASRKASVLQQERKE